VILLQRTFTSLVNAHVGRTQVSQRDAPPIGGFEVWFLSRFGGFV